LSPQSRRGRAQQTGRKPVGRVEAAPKSVKAAEPAVEKTVDSAPPAAPATAAAEPQKHAEGKRIRVAPARKKKQHGMVYRWVRAYMPLLAGLFVLLAVVWVYTSFIQAPTAAQRWTQIENKWSPPREAARLAAANATGDWQKQQAAYKDFYNQTKGWVDEVAAYKGWPSGTTDPATGATLANGTDAGDQILVFEQDGPRLLTVLKRAVDATNVYDYATAAGQLVNLDSSFSQDVYNVKKAFAISQSSQTPGPLAPPSVNPTPTQTPVPTPGPSGSIAPSPLATPAITPAPSPSPSAQPS
jgi:hypothetical protein